MDIINIPYGEGQQELKIDPDSVLAVVRPNSVNFPHVSQRDAVLHGMANPIGSETIDKIVVPGEKICILAPDITRSWQSTNVSVPLLVQELNRAGIKDKDMFILCACGTHRPQTREEHVKLFGEGVVCRIRIIDHQCEDKAHLADMGKTSRGTPVKFDSRAVEADKIISVCGVVYHMLAGFGGGGKMLLPGISGRDTIMRNHNLALNPGFGSGDNPDVRPGNFSSSNPVYMDIMEAASMLPPAFSLNVVVNDAFEIIRVFAGDWKKAHLEACHVVAAMDGVAIPERSSYVIGGAGGAPKDINLYQAMKLLTNALGAAKPGATIILLAQCPERFGNADCEDMIVNYDNMKDREEKLRGDFSIGAYSGYIFAEAAEKHDLIFVSDIPADKFVKTRAHAVKTLDEALTLAAKLNMGKKDVKAIVMPHGATTLPLPQKQ